MEKLSDVTYKIQKSQESDKLLVHVDHSKPYQEVSCENWLANETDLVPDSDVSLALNETGAEAGGTTHCKYNSRSSSYQPNENFSKFGRKIKPHSNVFTINKIKV